MRKFQIPTLQELKDFYPVYLESHRSPANRWMHVLGQVATFSYLAIVLYWSFAISFWILPFLLLTPIVIYPFAWTGHRLFETGVGSVPATLRPGVSVFQTKLSDLWMFAEMLTGKLPWFKRI